MPAINQIPTGAITRLKTMLEQRPAGGDVDTTFDVEQQVSFDRVVSQRDAGHGKWQGITATLYNFAIGEATSGPGDDDPQYVGLCKCPRPYASTTREYTDTPKETERFTDRVFGTYGVLNRPAPTRFGVVASAFNNDSSEAWEGIVEALGGDLTTAMNLGINVLPGLSQYATPHAVGRAIVDLVTSALTDEPEAISGDMRIVDTVGGIHWFRRDGRQIWRARKWVIHTLPSEPAWYLSQWFIELSAEARDYEYAMAPQSEVLGVLASYAAAMPASIDHDIAALRVLRGEALATVAERMRIEPGDVRAATESLTKADQAEALARIINVALSKLA
jgi:hypothetical protein